MGERVAQDAQEPGKKDNTLRGIGASPFDYINSK